MEEKKTRRKRERETTKEAPKHGFQHGVKEKKDPIPPIKISEEVVERRNTNYEMMLAYRKKEKLTAKQFLTVFPCLPVLRSYFVRFVHADMKKSILDIHIPLFRKGYSLIQEHFFAYLDDFVQRKDQVVINVNPATTLEIVQDRFCDSGGVLARLGCRSCLFKEITADEAATADEATGNSEGKKIVAFAHVENMENFNAVRDYFLEHITYDLSNIDVVCEQIQLF